MKTIPLQEAIDYALTHSFIKFNANFELVHAPMSLAPYDIPRSVHEHMKALTPLFNELMLHVSLDGDFLKECLTQASQTDAFLKALLQLHQSSSHSQSCQLMLNRNDYMLTQHPANPSDLQPKQVELNTIAASYPFLISRLTRLHQFVFRHEEWSSQLVENDPIHAMVSAIAEAVKYYDHPKACVLTLVQPHERNIFDQRGGEYQLWEQFGIPTLRLTLEEVAAEGMLREGHLVIRDHIVAVAYFRAGYTPSDYSSLETWNARNLIESSSAIAVPNVAMQLAGMKKIQQTLATPSILRKFIDDAKAHQIESTFVGLYLLDAMVENKGASAKELACRFPHDYVLKPQREGGGNNFYEKAMVEKLRSMDAKEYPAYILMERIPTVSHQALLAIEGQLQATLGVSEIGHFGVCFSEGKKIALNKDAGYLVRTKAADQNEGGVSAGYACLNTLRIH